jgi:hypothetical protein
MYFLFSLNNSFQRFIYTGEEGTAKLSAAVSALTLVPWAEQQQTGLIDTRRNGQPPKSQLTKRSTCQKVNLRLK